MPAAPRSAPRSRECWSPTPLTTKGRRRPGTASNRSCRMPRSSSSAWACVTTLSEPAPGSVDPCIGQSPLLEQQAIRASGVACQPAHSAHPAAPSVRTTTSAAVRLNSSSTTLGCMGRYMGVNLMKWRSNEVEVRQEAARLTRTPNGALRIVPSNVPASGQNGASRADSSQVA